MLILLAILYGLGAFYAQSMQWLPSWSLIYLVVINLLSFIFYGVDKLAAIKHWQRTPEKHFYVLALCCGWPGSVIGQMLFNHKTTKKPFRRYFYLMTFLSIAGVSIYLYPVIQLY